MRPFYEDSSAAKMLTPELSYRYAIRHMSNIEPTVYQLRKYNRDGSYDLLDTFVTRKGAEVAKSFADLELGQPIAIVGVTPSYSFIKSHLSSAYGSAVTEYIKRDEELTKGVM